MAAVACRGSWMPGFNPFNKFHFFLLKFLCYLQKNFYFHTGFCYFNHKFHGKILMTFLKVIYTNWIPSWMPGAVSTSAPTLHATAWLKSMRSLSGEKRSEYDRSERPEYKCMTLLPKLKNTHAHTRTHIDTQHSSTHRNTHTCRYI